MVKNNIKLNDYYMNIKHQNAKLEKKKWHFRKYYLFPGELEKHLSRSMKYCTGFIWNVYPVLYVNFKLKEEKTLLANQGNIKPVT